MRILHICTGNPFSEAMYYKENYLIDANLEDGHEVIILADTTMWDGNHLVSVPTCDQGLKNGARLIRVSFQNFGVALLSSKLRKVPGFSELVVGLAPDVILFHNIFQQGICDLPKIRNRLPDCKIYGDVSTSFENSAQNPLSKYVLHGMIYRRWLKRSTPYWDKIFYVAELSHDFLRTMYDVPEDLMELNPLPGRIMPLEEKHGRAASFREAHGLSPETLVLFHSGKMDARKKTVEILNIIRALPEGLDIHLFIAGSFYDDVRQEAEGLMAAMDCVTYLGFLSQDEMQSALAACDLYLQPGSASHTAQTAICCGVPVIVSDERIYRRFIDGNGYIIRNVQELREIILDTYAHREKLQEMSENAYRVAGEYFDYRKLAARLYR